MIECVAAIYWCNSIVCALQTMQSYILLLMTMQWVLIDLMTLDICGMITGTLADRVAGCAEII